MKFVIVITTFNRNEKVINTLKNYYLYQSKGKFFQNIFLTIFDDNPKSSLEKKIRDENLKLKNFIYIKNKINLGQGYNLVLNLEKILIYDYYWCPGDDDIILFDKLDEVIKILKNFNPTNMCLEFRQGKKLENGTFFDFYGIVNDHEKASNLICKFGKGSSTIFAKPTNEIINLVKSKFMGSMYEDKALSLLIFLFNQNRKLFVYNKLVSMGDEDFGTLRYSFRVFSNLEKVFYECMVAYNIKYQKSLNYYYSARSHSVFKLWIKGIYNTILKKEIRYTFKRLLKELFLIPILRIFNKSKFEKNF